MVMLGLVGPSCTRLNPAYASNDVASTGSAESGGGDGASSSSESTAASSSGLGPTSSGGALEEICNGVDDDGDGLIDEWSASNGACNDCNYVGLERDFFAVCGFEVTWIEAREHCISLGGDLASVHDDEEALEMAFPGARRRWIGLVRNRDDAWSWVDGSSVDYQRWEPGQPNNLEGAEDCVVALAPEARWHDTECFWMHAFVCRAPW